MVVGEFEPREVVRLAAAALGSWRGPTPGRTTSPAPLPPARLEVALLERPRARDSVIAIGTLGPDRAAPDAPGLRVALELMRTRSVIAAFEPHLDGPSLIALDTSAPLEATPLRVKTLLEALEDLRTRERSDEETQAAIRALANGFWVRAETNQALARLLTSTGTGGLEDDTLGSRAREPARRPRATSEGGRGAPPRREPIARGGERRLGASRSALEPFRARQRRRIRAPVLRSEGRSRETLERRSNCPREGAVIVPRRANCGQPWG